MLEQGVTACAFEVVRDHLLNHFVKRDFGNPAELAFCLGRVAQQGFDFGRTKVASIDPDKYVAYFHRRRLVTRNRAHHGALFDTRAQEAERDAELQRGFFDELAYCVLHTGSDHVVPGLVLLQHHPLHTHIVLGVTPIAQCIHVAHEQAIF